MKMVIELSTGGAEEADDLAALLEGSNAEWMIGIINAYPHMIGDDATVLSCVGTPAQWEAHGDIISAMGGASVHVGEKAGMLAALFAGLFTVRQGFMFGMIFGALLCKKAGVSMETYVEQMPLTIKVVHDYYDVFAASVPTEDFDNPQASIDTYVAAFNDTLESFRENGANTELPELMSRLVNMGANAGMGDKQITALVNLLNNPG